MKAFIRRALCAVGLTGGVVIVGFGLAQAASADTGSGPVTSGQSGIVSGNQTGVDAKAPVNASGNQVTVIGQRNHTTATGSSSTGTSSPSGSSGSPTTSGQDGGGSGNQTAVGVQAPVNASGNQVTVIGQDNTTHSSSTASSQGSGGSSGSPTTSGQNGIGSGNQTAVGVQAPVNVSCNQVTVIGQDNSSQCAGASSSSAPASGSPVTTGQDGILSGNQTGLGVLLPINVSGNQVTVIGQDNTLGSSAASSTGTSGNGGAAGAPTTSGESGIGSGNQTGITALAPIAVTGNQVTVIGQDNTVSSTGGSTTGGPTAGGTSGSSTGPVTSGESGIGSGNQTGITALAPIAVTGNQVTVIGQDNTVSSTGGTSTGGTSGSTTGPVTSGESGIGSGNQTGITVLAPIAATGNQVTVIGQDNTVTSTGGSSTGGGSAGGETTDGAGGIGSGNQTPIDVQAPVDTSGNQVTVIGQDNSTTSTSGSTGGGTPGGSTGGVVSPPAGGTVTLPTGGTATGVNGPQGSATPGSSVLPNTGLGGALPWLAAFGLLLLALGSLLLRRAATGAGTPAVVRAG